MVWRLRDSLNSPKGGWKKFHERFFNQLESYGLSNKE